jgi:hypothetical protein
MLSISLSIVQFHQLTLYRYYPDKVHADLGKLGMHNIPRSAFPPQPASYVKKAYEDRLALKIQAMVAQFQQSPQDREKEAAAEAENSKRTHNLSMMMIHSATPNWTCRCGTNNSGGTNCVRCGGWRF